MKNKFSPAPWKMVKHHPSPQGYIIRPFLTVNDNDGNELAVLNGNPKRFSKEELEVFYADGKIMALAPEMVALLDEIRRETYETLDEDGNGILAIPEETFNKIAGLFARK